MNKSTWIVTLPALSLLWLVVTMLTAGTHYPNYQHTSQFMSELAATGAPHGFWVNYLGFIPTEIFLMVFLKLVWPCLPKSKLKTLGFISFFLYAASLAMAAIFQCDFECRPSEPTLSHQLHLLLGLLGYLFAIIGIVLLSIDCQHWHQAKRVSYFGWVLAVLASILLINLDPHSNFVGLIQRILELCIYTWLIVLALYVRSSMTLR